MAGLFQRATVAAAAALALCAAMAGQAQAAPVRQVLPAAPGSVPNPGYFNTLSSVDALSPSNAWAVGSYCKTNCDPAPVFHNMIEHWNGTAWSTVSSPNLQNSSLGGVTVLSATNAWAVGGYTLTAVSASSANNIWAVGYGAQTTAALRWNGTKWSQVKTPSPGKYTNLLEGVSADSASDAWAVGWYCASGCTGGTYTTRGMILRWNGTAWSTAKLPVTNSTDITAVHAFSATDAWAVGTAATGTLVLHWNGTVWTKVAAPSLYPSAMAFSSASNGWVAGTGSSLLRWNGSAWKTAPTTAPSSSYFGGISADSASDAWAVGNYCVSNCTSSNPRDDTITMRWNGTTWSRQ
jgi:hypothetical protein